MHYTDVTHNRRADMLQNRRSSQLYLLINFVELNTDKVIGDKVWNELNTVAQLHIDPDAATGYYKCLTQHLNDIVAKRTSLFFHVISAYLSAALLQYPALVQCDHKCVAFLHAFAMHLEY